MAHLRIGSRGSQLALWQANHISEWLRQRGHTVSIEVIKTTGDKITDVALAKVGTKGMFTKEIEDALAEGRVDLAVHSLKDVPTELPPGFLLAAVPKREDARDVLLSQNYARIEALPRGARVGTSSLRRQAQLLALRPDLEVIPLRGNVDTRVKKLQSGAFDAILLAAAGVSRLGLGGWVREYLSTDQMCPAAGQGALAVEARAEDTSTLEAVSLLEDPATRVAIQCERALLSALGGGCQVPIGAHAEAAGSGLMLRAVVASPSGEQIVRHQQTGLEAGALGAAAAEALLARGARQILDGLDGTQAEVPEQP